eukprot:CAMPEP_0114118648 /NCGR_PEP_ID=MMETSP0043_2-20121206/5690_1 /TAXON_ID=464988 /ORGANISM="Hemiselmis andersenii, Strain CCMP644" /LENGTH=127 /DNA_ID=CAMNT_0001211143 /DNA_START=381 /DNA_END=763 /DNA_ORIENTATION=-
MASITSFLDENVLTTSPLGKGSSLVMPIETPPSQLLSRVWESSGKTSSRVSDSSSARRDLAVPPALHFVVGCLRCVEKHVHVAIHRNNSSCDGPSARAREGGASRQQAFLFEESGHSEVVRKEEASH